MKIHPINTIAIAASVCLFASGSVSGEPAVKEAPATGYQLYKAGQLFPNGTVLSSKNQMSMKDATVNMVMQEQKINGTMTRTGAKEIVKTINSAEKVTVKVIKNESQGTMTLNGKAMPQPKETEGLHGKTAVFTLADGKWVGMLVDGEADEAAKKAIKEREDNMNDPDDAVIMGTDLRKVGDQWEVDPTKLSTFAGSDTQKLTGTFKMTFQSIEEYKGMQCAILVADIDVTGKTDEGQDLNLKGKVTVKHSLKYCTSLAFSLDGQFNLKGQLKGGAGEMTVNGPMKMEKVTTVKLP